MRFRLKTLLAIVTLTAMGMGAFWWYQYYESLKLIPFTSHTQKITEYEPPPEIRVRFGKAAIDELAFARKRYDVQQKQSSQQSSYWKINRIVAQPQNAFRVSKETLVKHGVDVDGLRKQLNPLLSDHTVDIENKIQYSNLLINLGDRSGLDWIIKHLQSGENRSSDGDEFVAFLNAPLKWLDGIDVWPLIKPRSVKDRFENQRKAAQRLCPEKWHDHYLAKLRDPETDPKWRLEIARWFHYAMPTLEGLEASEFLFAPPEENYKWGHHPYHLFLEKYFEVGDPQITELATRFAKPLALDRHQFSREYFQLLVQYGDESCDDFFQAHLETPLLKDRAFVALADRSNDPLGVFWQAVEERSSFERIALRQLQFRLAGTKDPRLSKFYRDQFNGSKHRFIKSQALYGMLLLHADDSMDYYQKLRDEFPTDFDDPKLLKELLQLLKSYDLGEDLIGPEIVIESMRTGNDGAPFLSSDHIAIAIQRAGLHHNVDMLQLAEDQLWGLSIMSRGEVDIKTVVPKYADQAIAFDVNGIVYEFDISEPDVFYDPHLVADILNAILARQKIANRFIAHDTETSDANFFYGPPELARQLRDTYGIKFMPGTEAYLDEEK